MPTNQIVLTAIIPEGAIGIGSAEFAIGLVLPFLRIDGVPDLPGQTLKIIEKQGLPGFAAKRQGAKAESSVLQCMSIAGDTGGLLNNVLWTEAMYKNFQGQQVTVYDGHGTYYSGLVVERVRTVRKKRIAGAIVNTTAYAFPVKIWSEWTVRYPYGGF